MQLPVETAPRHSPEDELTSCVPYTRFTDWTLPAPTYPVPTDETNAGFMGLSERLTAAAAVEDGNWTDFIGIQHSAATRLKESAFACDETSPFELTFLLGTFIFKTFSCIFKQQSH